MIGAVRDLARRALSLAKTAYGWGDHASAGYATLTSGGTFLSDISVPDEAYGAGWNGSAEVPTKNALYDKIESLSVGGVSDGDKGDITVSGSGATWTIDNGVVTLAKMADIATSSLIYRKTAGTGAPEVQTLATLKTDLGLTGTNSGDQTSIVGITGTLAEFNTALTGADFATGGGTATGTNTGDQTITLTGDVTGSGTGSFAATIASDAVTNAKMANMATATFKGRATAGTGDPEDLTGTQATALLDTFTSGAKGLAPASGGGTSNFLRADGTWTTPSASVAWGGITGTLSSQTDLESALNAKAALAGATFTGQVVLPANSSSLTPLKFQSGTLDSSIEAGGQEYDGNAFYGVIDTVAGRGFSEVSQFFMLAADAGAAIGPAIADFFGSNSSINLKAASIYMIEYELWFLKTTAGTVTFTLTNTQAPVNMNAGWEGSVSGIGASGAMTRAGLRASTSAAAAMPATPSIADAANVFYRVRVLVETHATVNGNLRLRATESAGTITPRRGSWYRVTRIPSTSVGTFSA